MPLPNSERERNDSACARLTAVCGESPKRVSSPDNGDRRRRERTGPFNFNRPGRVIIGAALRSRVTAGSGSEYPRGHRGLPALVQEVTR